LAGETEVLGENLPQRHFCPSQNPTWPDPGLNPGRCSGKCNWLRFVVIEISSFWQILLRTILFILSPDDTNLSCFQNADLPEYKTMDKSWNSVVPCVVHHCQNLFRLTKFRFTCSLTEIQHSPGIYTFSWPQWIWTKTHLWWRTCNQHLSLLYRSSRCGNKVRQPWSYRSWCRLIINKYELLLILK
jgi:hypothetical protein